MEPKVVVGGGGGDLCKVYGGSGLSPAKTQVSVVNSGRLKDDGLHFHPRKSRLNFAREKIYTSARENLLRQPAQKTFRA